MQDFEAIRQRIADENGIAYAPKECFYEGECKGTCAACEAEVRYLESELKRKQRNGLSVKAGGIAAGVCAMAILSSEGVWRTLTPNELYGEVEIDDLYFMATGGGICFGGGEPLLHSDFIVRFEKIMNPLWKLTLETSLNVPLEHLQAVAPLVSQYIVDVKDIHLFIYKAYTGRDNNRVIDNLKWIKAQGLAEKTIIRLPLIPEFNDEKMRQESKLMLEEMGFSTFDEFKYRVKYFD